MKKDLLSTLSPRERQVMKLVVKGRTSKAIGHELDLTMETIRSYRKTMMAKLKAHSLVDLIKVAAK